eukprot:8096117-Pyramimonas_sp.AAC.1
MQKAVSLGASVGLSRLWGARLEQGIRVKPSAPRSFWGGLAGAKAGAGGARCPTARHAPAPRAWSAWRDPVGSL